MRGEKVVGLLRARPVKDRRHLHLGAYRGDASVETLLAQRGWETTELLERSRVAIRQLVTGRVGGDCWADDPGPAGADLPAQYVLVIGATAELNETAASSQNPLPVVFEPRDANQAAKTDARRRGWHILSRHLSPWTLLDGARSVQTRGGEIGFLALLRGIAVHSFAPTFYAGWGLTTDHDADARPHTRSVEELFAAHCLLTTDYRDPHGSGATTFEAVCEFLTHWRRFDAANRRIKACVGMSHWKRNRIAEFLASSGGAPRFARTASKAVEIARARGGSVAVWGPREPEDLRAAAADANVPIVHIEDGFLRSVGLGADFTPAASIVVDERGIYYDPSRPSDLEHILNHTTFEASLVQRSAGLIDLVVAAGITKYNTGARAPSLAHSGNRRRIFVPGQVEDDRSVLLGGGEVKSNLDLLRNVRRANPDAFIVYKPHPDVDAGHRMGVIPEVAALGFADQVVRRVSSAALIAATDEVHTMTSLTGFEALLRRKHVVTYGRPFYAGWGLTQDLSEQERRRRRLSLEELAAGVLILYPRYIDPVSRLPCTPEHLISRLVDRDLWAVGLLTRLRQMQGVLMRAVRQGSARWRLRAS